MAGKKPYPFEKGGKGKPAKGKDMKGKCPKCDKDKAKCKC